jgi:GGDEF domain-containing protein
VLELVISDCRARGRPAALSLVRIVDYGAYVAAHGQDKGEALLAQVADMLQAIPAPLAVYLTAYGPGSFMLIHPGAPSASELEDWNARAAEAVEMAAIHHGNSIQAEHVTLWTRTVWAEPSGLAAAADTIIDRTKQELLERQ